MTTHPSWIEIDLKQFKKNISILRAYIGNSLYCLPVKANAYGQGIIPVSRAAVSAGIDYLAVAHLGEGIILREANIEVPILVLGAIHENQVIDLIRYSLEFSISSMEIARMVVAKCQGTPYKCRVHLEIDTGMERTGVKPSDAIQVYEYLKSHNCFEVVGIYTHLATASGPNDPFTLKQIEAFSSLIQDPVLKNTPLIKHIANSGGTMFYPEAHLDMVRPSILTFGYYTGGAPEPLREIRPFFSLKSKVSFTKVVEKGTGISYGHTYVTDKQSAIATIPVGYGDGYPRCLSNRGSVLIRGCRFPIIGTICMDQFMVDVTGHEVRVGDEVVLIGKQGEEEITVDEIAGLCKTIPYEVICFFTDRLPRIYV